MHGYGSAEAGAGGRGGGEKAKAPKRCAHPPQSHKGSEHKLRPRSTVRAVSPGRGWRRTAGLGWKSKSYKYHFRIPNTNTTLKLIKRGSNTGKYR